MQQSSMIWRDENAFLLCTWLHKQLLFVVLTIRRRILVRQEGTDSSSWHGLMQAGAYSV
jgi:hypothetical protein